MTFEKTKEELLQELLANISDDWQKTIGHTMYDFSFATAYSLEELSTDLQTAYEKTDVDNLTGDELTKWVLQRKGLIRKVAACGTTSLTVDGNFTVNEGDLFESEGGLQFEATETVTSTTTAAVNVQCTTTGSIGNIAADTITLMPVQIPGVTSVTNDNPVTGGYDEESDSELRTRYYEALQLPITSGNKYHYKKWAKEVTGVGDAKVFPLEYGVNTVEVVIIDSNKEPAGAELVAEVQEYIDPNFLGTGEGQAPIGAYCTVNAASALNLDISVSVTIAEGYDIAGVTTNIETAITSYLKGIAFLEDYISYAKVGSVIINTEGVSDYEDLLINSGTSNVSIGSKEVPLLNSLSVADSDNPSS